MCVEGNLILKRVVIQIVTVKVFLEERIEEVE